MGAIVTFKLVALSADVSSVSFTSDSFLPFTKEAILKESKKKPGDCDV